MTLKRKGIILTGVLLALSFAAFTNKAPAKSNTQDEQKVAHREDVSNLPDALKTRLVELAGRPHSYLPLTVFSG
jgi:hypothetical protein